MSTEVNKCPMCNIKLRAEGDRMVCKLCGYYRRADANAASDLSFESSSSAFGYDVNHAPQSTYSRSSGQSNVSSVNARAMVARFVIAMVVCMCAVVIAVIVNITSDNQNKDNDDDKVAVSTDKDSTKGTASGSAATELPTSELFQLLAETLFGVSYTDVTAEQYASVTYLEICRDDYSIYCTVDGEDYSYTYDSGMSYSTKDFKCFTGLEVLVLEDISLNQGDLRGLENLTELYCDNTLEETFKIVPNAKKLVSLGVYDPFVVRDVAGIGVFSNLQYLYMEGDYLEDISGLAELSGLVELSIMNADNLMDLSVLSQMDSLTSIYLQCPNLKNLGFLKGKQLQYFAVEDSKIRDISALEASKDTLVGLSLLNNYDVQDYTLVGEMTNLIELEMHVRSDAVLPSFKNLQKLDYVYANYFDDIACIADAKNLTEVWLEQCSMYNLEALTALDKLTILTINDTRNYLDNLHPLTEMKSLQILDISETTIFGYVEELLGIPTLQELYMDDCRVGFNFDKAPKNENLLYWSLNNTQIIANANEDEDDYEQDYGVRETFCQYPEVFKNYPNLMGLYVAGNDLDNLDFVQYLPNLVAIDVSNNYIDSLQPLKAISTLGYVWCKDNTISDGYDLGANVSVITDVSTAD